MTALDDLGAWLTARDGTVAAAAFAAGAASRQGEIASWAASLNSLQKTLDDYRAAHPDTPPVVVIEPKYPIPATAIWVSPNGNDNNPGTEARPKATPPFNVPVVFDGGQYNAFKVFAPNGSKQSWYVPEGKRAVLDGGGNLASAITAGGFTDLYGAFVVQNYAPKSKNNGSNAPIFYGGTSAGSTIDGLLVRASTMAGFGFQNQLNIVDLTLEDLGYCGLMGATAQGTKIGTLRISRVNRNGNTQDGQLAACKLGRCKDVTVDSFIGRDIPIANGFWLDEGCQGFDLGYFDIDGAGTDGTSKMAHGVHIEITQGGKMRGGGKVRGSMTGGVMVLDSGAVDVWGWDLRGNFVGLWAQQDDRDNSAGHYAARSGSFAEDPMRTRDLSLLNCTFDGNNQVWAYANKAVVPVAGEDFFKEVRGNWFAPKAATGMALRMGDRQAATVAQTSRSVTLAQLSATLGARMSSNYQGIDVAEAAKIRVALP